MLVLLLFVLAKFVDSKLKSGNKVWISIPLFLYIFTFFTSYALNHVTNNIVWNMWTLLLETTNLCKYFTDTKALDKLFTFNSKHSVHNSCVGNYLAFFALAVDFR